MFRHSTLLLHCVDWKTYQLTQRNNQVHFIFSNAAPTTSNFTTR